MAVPKKKISKSKTGLRRGSNYKTTLPNVIIDKDTGEYKLPNQIAFDAQKNGYYKGRKVIEGKKPKKEETEEK